MNEKPNWPFPPPTAAPQLFKEPLYTADEIAAACAAVEIPDSKFEALMIELKYAKAGQ